jgi:6-pyruvoyltetrahydropterin/6-carboxytetrahydropterin synthase
MFEIRVKTDFSAAHNLRNYHGKCERLHGHNWALEAVFGYRSLAKDGMAVDFKIARAVLKEAVCDLDHAYLNELKALKGMNPTSENIAKFIFDRVSKKNKNIKSIAVWENKDSCAVYSKM